MLVPELQESLEVVVERKKELRLDTFDEKDPEVISSGSDLYVASAGSGLSDCETASMAPAKSTEGRPSRGGP